MSEEDKLKTLEKIDLALHTLDPIKENHQLIKISNDAISIAKSIDNTQYEAYYKGKKAEFLLVKAGFTQYKLHNLKLVPGWMEFSLESEKAEYKNLSEEVDNLEGDAVSLINDALRLSKKTNDVRTEAYVLISKGVVYSTLYLQKQADCFVGNEKTKWWMRLRQLRGTYLMHLYVFTSKQRRELNNLANIFTDDFINSANIFEELDQDSGAGYAYFNLANNLNTISKFKKSKKYLQKAEQVARKHGDPDLIQRINLFKKILKSKHKDISDYVGEEVRNDM